MAQTEKQMEYRRCATHRWNIKTGATRSGKTYGDYYIIPRRILAVAGKEGSIVLLGNTKGTLQRNIIDPMQSIWGSELVSPIRSSDNTAMLFGQRVYCLGADNVKHVNRIRGMSISYCYGDEVATWKPDVFEMLKSRLDKPWSLFDGTCNPEGPQHWFKKFLDGDADIYHQHYTLDDNPFLPARFAEELRREYAGTVYYDRFILGRWVAAEGAIYRLFADNTARYLRPVNPGEIGFAYIGVDFGGNGSAHAFSLLGTDRRFQHLQLIDEYYRKEVIAPNVLENDFVAFCRSALDRGYRIAGIYADSAEQVLIRGLKNALYEARVPLSVSNARKSPINDRIRFFNRMMGAERFHIDPHCIHTIEALQAAVWDGKHLTKDVRLDDGTLNIDSLDAMEYAVENVMSSFIR